MAEEKGIKIYTNEEVPDVPFPKKKESTELPGQTLINPVIKDEIQKKIVSIIMFTSVESMATGDGTLAVAIPSSLNGYRIIKATATVHTKGVTGSTTIQIRRRRAGSNVDMLTTKISLGDEYYASSTDIDNLYSDIQEGDQVYVDVDTIHSGTAPKGLSVVLTFN